ncbi:MAG: hypothetical protein CMN72_01980, partial [Sphingomonas sp.]|nr:hypothetical protein [Sphingomonas sp.]
MNAPETMHATISTSDDPLWYKDAVIYQVHVKSFFDSNDDGIGDFAGLMAKLDYIADLGVTAIWLLPFYPSPRRDDGYDIAEYRDVSPDYGTMEEVRAFLESVNLLTNVVNVFVDKLLIDLKVNAKRCEELIDQSLMMVTSLAPQLGYD